MGLVTDRLPRVVEHIPGGGILITSIDALINWSRRNSLWPLAFGTKCCAIEMLMATGAPHQDLSRFGAEVARQSPRQADFMVVAGAVVKKMAPRVPSSTSRWPSRATSWPPARARSRAARSCTTPTR